jgi:hypothetical protein
LINKIEALTVMLSSKYKSSILIKIRSAKEIARGFIFDLDFEGTDEFKGKEIQIDNEKLEIITSN